MANYAIITDLNRCTGCLACTVACKAHQRRGRRATSGSRRCASARTPIEGGSGALPRRGDVLPPHAVPALREPRVREGVPHRGVSHVAEDGTVQIDKVEVHRLPVLRHGLPLWRALPERGRARRGEVHPVRAAH